MTEAFLFVGTLLAVWYYLKRRRRKITAAEWLEGMRELSTSNPVKFPPIPERHARVKE